MSDIAFSMSADDRDVTRALQNLIKENAKLREEMARGVDESKRAAAQEREWAKLRERTAKEAIQQQQQMNAAAQKIKDSIATPYDEAKKKVEELRKHLQAGTLTTDEYRKAYANVAKELRELTRDHAAEAAAAAKAKAEVEAANKAAAESQKEYQQAVKEANLVSQKYATTEEKVAREIERLNKLRDKGVLSAQDHARAVEGEQKKMATGAETSTRFASSLEGVAGKMVTAVAGFASMTAVVQGLRAEYENLIATQGKSKDAQLSLAAEQEALLMNLGGANAGQVTGQIRDLSKRSGVREVDVTRAVNEAMAARGDLDVGSIIQAVGTATKVRKFAPQELAGLAAATIDTQKQTGLGTDASLGFLLQMQAQSRTKNLKSLAENFTPAVGGVMNFGADRQTAGAMLAALSHGMGDTTGAQSATAAIQLSKQLREFGGGAPIAQTMQMLQQNAALRQQFLGGASFEAKALPAIESLLGGGRQAQQFAAARQALNQNPMAALNEAVAARTPAALQVAGLQNALQNQLDQRRLSNPMEAVSSVIRDFRQSNTSETQGVFATKIENATELLRKGATEDFDRVLRDAQMLGMSDTRKIAPMNAAEVAAMRLGAGAPKTTPLSPEELQKVTEADKARASEARALVEILTEIRDNLKKDNGGAAIGRANNQREGAGT